MKNKVLENVIVVLALVASFVAGAFLVLKAPQLHSDYIRKKTEQNVLLMHTSDGVAIGTGFLLQHKGKVIAVTNNHICEFINDRALATTKDEKVRLFVKKVKSDVNVDLCMLEVESDLGDLEGLKLAEDVKLGQEVMVTGHPKVLPYTLNRGQIIGVQTVQVFMGPVYSKAQYDKCMSDKGYIIDAMMGYLCLKDYQGAYTTVLGMPGNSGSPSIDFFGNVIGVVFAANNYGWMILVPLPIIKEFLD